MVTKRGGGVVIDSSVVVKSACRGGRCVLERAPTPHVKWSLPVEGPHCPKAVHCGRETPVNGQVHHLVEGHQLHCVELTIVDRFSTVRGKQKADVIEKYRFFTSNQPGIVIKSSPVDGVSWLAAGVIADFDVTLEELHCDMIVVSIVQQDTIILSCGHLPRKTFHNEYLSYLGT